MKISNFKTDEEREIKGVWVSIGPGAKLLVARMNNPLYIKELRKEMSPYSTSVASLEESEAERIVINSTAKTVLLDWEGLMNDDGEEVPYSVETAAEWLKEYKEFRKLVVNIASDIDNYRKAAVDEVQQEIKKQ